MAIGLSKPSINMHFPAARDLDIDIEKYILRFIPRSRLHLLPRPISHVLGYRDSPRKEIGNLLVAGWSFFGAFCGVAIIERVFMSPVLRAHGTPLIVGSFVRLPLGGRTDHRYADKPEGCSRYP